MDDFYIARIEYEILSSQKQAYAWPDTHQNLNTRKLTRCFLIREEGSRYLSGSWTYSRASVGLPHEASMCAQTMLD